MKQINILFSGDFAPILDPKEITGDEFRNLEYLFSIADIHVTNLECPLTTFPDPIKKIGPSIKADPKAISILKNAYVTISCLANNHIFDYEEEGIKDTIKICEENGIETIGIVNRGDGKQHWLIKEIEGIRIGFANYCEHEFSVRGSSFIGANGYDSISCFHDILYLRARVDYLFVVYHGGNEYFSFPSPKMKRIFHYLVDLGADAVVGHHTHVISGIENYKGKPLIYGLGNFFFPYKNEPEDWYVGAICKFSLEDTIAAELIPFHQCKEKNQISLLSSDMIGKINRNISFISDVVLNDDLLEKLWDNYVETKAISYLKQVPGLGFLSKVLLKIGVPISELQPYSKNILIYNILRCQSHFDILISALRKQVTR